MDVVTAHARGAFDSALIGGIGFATARGGLPVSSACIYIRKGVIAIARPIACRCTGLLPVIILVQVEGQLRTLPYSFVFCVAGRVAADVVD